MRYVNIVYEYDYNDADIIAVPDDICGCILNLAQDFCDWLGGFESDFTAATGDGRKVIDCETAGFICWLNMYVLHRHKEKAFIVNEHTIANPSYDTVDF